MMNYADAKEMARLEAELAQLREYYADMSSALHTEENAHLKTKEAYRQVVEAAGELMTCYMITDEWGDSDNTPCYEAARSDLMRDKRLMDLAAALEELDQPTSGKGGER